MSSELFVAWGREAQLCLASPSTDGGCLLEHKQVFYSIQTSLKVSVKKFSSCPFHLVTMILLVISAVLLNGLNSAMVCRPGGDTGRCQESSGRETGGKYKYTSALVNLVQHYEHFCLSGRDREGTKEHSLRRTREMSRDRQEDVEWVHWQLFRVRRRMSRVLQVVRLWGLASLLPQIEYHSEDSIRRQVTY